MAADHRENQSRRKGPSWGFRVQDGGLGGFSGIGFKLGLRVQVRGFGGLFGMYFGSCRAPVGVWEAQRDLEGLGFAQGRLGTQKWAQHGLNLSQVGANLVPRWNQLEPTWSQLGPMLGPDRLK